MNWQRVLLIARREYLAAVRRKAFVFTLIGMPLYFAFVMTMTIKPGLEERRETLQRLARLGVVDSSGLYGDAEREIRTQIAPDPLRHPERTETVRSEIRFFPDAAAAEAALRDSQVSQVLLIPADYLKSGKVRRLTAGGGTFSSSADVRPIQRWLARNLLAGRVDAAIADRAARPTVDLETLRLSKSGGFELEDDRRELAGFLVPFAIAMLLGVSIVIGGQYLLQSLSEEKESRILESLLCTVSAEDLLAGKLIGLGAVGLTMVGVWTVAGAMLGGPAAALLNVKVPPGLLALALVYFLLGYLFYASLMTGIGAVTNNMREAQQFSFMFTFANFVPFILIMTILNHPDRPLPVILSLFPPTAPVTMMLRAAVPSATIPAWQIALSLALLVGAAILALRMAARLFRIGLLLYGKTPNLPEILRWARAR